MSQLAIKGSSIRGKEVIEILEMLGGINKHQIDAIRQTHVYFIDIDGIIRLLQINQLLPEQYVVYSLEEFEKLYPYKVGDKVTLDNKLYSIIWMYWECNNIYYQVQGADTTFTKKVTANKLKPYKEENYCQVIGNDTSSNGVNTAASLIDESINITNKVIFDTQAQACDIMNDIIKKDIKEIKIDIPNGYEFFGIDDDNKIVFTKKQPQYPTTYLECCRIVNASPCVMLVYDISNGQKYSYDVDNLQIHNSLRKLKICRDAYWKIYGEQMGLGKPWGPTNETVYCISRSDNVIKSSYRGGKSNILEFPIEEMRDAFFDNFKDLINECKELL